MNFANGANQQLLTHTSDTTTTQRRHNVDTTPTQRRHNVTVYTNNINWSALKMKHRRLTLLLFFATCEKSHCGGYASSCSAAPSLRVAASLILYFLLLKTQKKNEFSSSVKKKKKLEKLRVNASKYFIGNEEASLA